MKKVLLLLALSSVSVIAHAAPTKHSEQMLAQVDSITVYSGDNVDSQKQAVKTITKALVPSFEKCAVYLPKGASKASTTITLSRDADGKFSLECAGQ
ncbi:hypothetical protein UA32_03230 [Photobacterium angustum]|uniref:Uncharacterized protein n=1 Tax=Photobacterium angustum TaxID=661 RepID=A0ABX5H8U3_PHOAN|nr:hypothetical protein [Photobacterium angustum]KJG40784.1 hypothetical protein UA32_03230 [Photobacterium angustum]PSX12118.1 hypothetical protein C0W27_02695 [Photobacterium angustum]